MATIARLSADLTANTSRFEMGMKRSNAVMNQSRQIWGNALNQSGRNFDRFGGRVNASTGAISNLRGEMRNLAISAAGALSIQKIIQYADTWKSLEGRLKIINSDMKVVRQTQDDLFQAAQRSGAPLESITTLYTKLNQSLTQNQRAQFDVIGITETFGKALAVTGEGASQSASAILQFTQAVQSDFKNSAQEINSLIDSAPRVAAVLRDMAAKSGKSLKEFAKDGGLSTASVLQALEDAGVKIGEEFNNIEGVVSRSMTKLDNAFLQYIGTSELAISATNKLADGIDYLADNFDTFAAAVVTIVGLTTGRFVVALVASRVALANAAIAAQANAVAITRATLAAGQNTRMALAMAKAQQAAAGSVAANTIVVNRLGLAVAANATIMTRFTAAAMLAGRGLLAAFGGPVGLAITAVTVGVVLLSNRTSDLEKTQERLNNIQGKSLKVSQQLVFASGERKKALEVERQQLIENAKTEVQTALISLNASLKKFDEIEKSGLSFTGIIPKVLQGQDIEKKAEALKRAQETLAQINEDFSSTVAGANTPLGGSGDGKDVYGDIIKNLQKESKQLEIQTSLYGEKEAAIKRALAAAEIEQKLSEAGIALSKKQQEEIERYLESIQKQTELQAEQEKQQKRLEEQEKNRQQALDQLGASFESAFEDAIVSGEKLSDVLNALLQDILKMQIRRSIIEPIFGGDMLSGFFGKIGGAIFGGGASHATGQANVPYDMNVRVHKGERIVPAQMNKSMSRSGGNFILNVTNNTDAQVKSGAPQSSANGTELEIMIDRAVAKNVNKRGSQTNQALGTFNQRTLVRR